MASNSENIAASGETLSEMFTMGLKLHTSLDESSEPTNSEKFQHGVKKAILLLEDATRLVSILDIFSRNETVSEVPTEHLKFFLLPVLLGDLNSKLIDQDRMDVIKIVEVYYLDFLRRIRDYEVYSVKIPDIRSFYYEHVFRAFITKTQNVNEI